MTTAQGGLVIHGAALTAVRAEKTQGSLRRSGAGRHHLEAWAQSTAPWLAEARLTHECVVCGAADHGRPLLLCSGVEHPGARLSCTRVPGPEGGWLLLALLVRTETGDSLPAGFAVGLDAEPNARAAQMGDPAWQEFAFSAGERELIAAAGDPQRPALRRWVLKEALAKAAGTGLREDPSGIDTTTLVR